MDQSSFALTTFVVKVSSRCNLNCSYCYMYNLEDKTYRGQPAIMQEPVTVAFAKKATSHAKRHGAKRIHVILHGGEPLLLGKTRLRNWVSCVREHACPEVEPCFSIQSNGVLIDDEWIDLLADLGVRIGISVDGPKAIHDRHRRDHHGRGSFDRVRTAIRKLRTHPRGQEIFSSVMAVVCTDVAPDELFEFWMDLDVPSFDLSLPHANHDHPPEFADGSLGDWLVEFFDCYVRANRPDLSVRYFDNMLRMFFNYPVSTDNIGGRPVDVVVVETDGSIEPTDAFKCCAEGITKLGLNVLRDEFDTILTIPLVAELQQGRSALCRTCQGCEARDVCGGGYMPHRYGNGHFQNTSVYCRELWQLTHHMRERIQDSIPPDLFRRIESNTRDQRVQQPANA